MAAIGVGLEILAAATGTASKQLMAASEHFGRPMLLRLGLVLNMVVGPVLDAGAFAFAPQVVVAPLGCLDVVFNALTASWTLQWQGERLTSGHVLGTALVAFGAMVSSLSADGDNVVLNASELEERLFLRPSSVAFLTIQVVALLMAAALLQRRTLHPLTRGITLGTTAGVLMGNSYFLKGFIGLIQISLATGNLSAWLTPTPYVLAVGALGGALGGTIVMQRGLSEYKSVFMVTFVKGAQIATACLSACVLMGEMDGAPWWRCLVYLSSILLITGGMLVIVAAAPDARIGGHEEPKEEEKKGDAVATHQQDLLRARTPLSAPARRAKTSSRGGQDGGAKVGKARKRGRFTVALMLSFGLGLFKWFGSSFSLAKGHSVSAAARTGLLLEVVGPVGARSGPPAVVQWVGRPGRHERR